MSAQDILSLVSRLDAAYARRRELADQRSTMVAEFKRTGKPADSFGFSNVCSELRISEMEIQGLQGALDALKTLGGGL